MHLRAERGRGSCCDEPEWQLSAILVCVSSETCCILVPWASDNVDKVEIDSSCNILLLLVEKALLF